MSKISVQWANNPGGASWGKRSIGLVAEIHDWKSKLATFFLAEGRRADQCVLGGGDCKNTKKNRENRICLRLKLFVSGEEATCKLKYKNTVMPSKKNPANPMEQRCTPPSHFFSTSQPLNVHGSSQNLSYQLSCSRFKLCSPWPTTLAFEYDASIHYVFVRFIF